MTNKSARRKARRLRAAREHVANEIRTLQTIEKVKLARAEAVLGTSQVSKDTSRYEHAVVFGGCFS